MQLINIVFNLICEIYYETVVKNAWEYQGTKN